MSRLWMDAEPTREGGQGVEYPVNGPASVGGPGGEYIQELIVRGDIEPPLGRNSITINGGNTMNPGH